MKYYAVIDTNVIVSSTISHNSIPGIIVDMVTKDEIIVPLLNDEILDEYVEVLSRNKFGFTQEQINQIIKEIKLKAIYLPREKTIEKFIDQKDIVFYEIVMSARRSQEAYLITGNNKHFPVKNYVVTPREMLEIISKDNPNIVQLN